MASAFSPLLSLSSPRLALCSSSPTSFSPSRLPNPLQFAPSAPILRLGLRGSQFPLFIARAAAEEPEDNEVGAVETEEGQEGDAVEDSDAGEAQDEEEKPPRQPRIKLGDIMGILNKRAIEAVEKERTVPDIRTGDVVVIKLEVPENRRRASIYKGIVISKQNAGIHTTIRIRRIIAGIGVEIVFPVYSPNIKEIKVVNHRKVRRARLYYLRNKLPRLSTFK